MPSDYRVLSDTVKIQYEVKKSEFIAIATPAQTRQEAMACLAAIREQYPDARHHCWAYLLGNPHSPLSVAMSDDGEPSGTAGKPILNVLQHKDVGDIMLVVVRYFGGIKLGAGGLVRAYSASAQQVMEILPTTIKVALTEVKVEGDYGLEQALRHWLSSRDGELRSVDYGERVIFTLAVREKALDELEAFVLGNSGVLSRSV